MGHLYHSIQGPWNVTEEEEDEEQCCQRCPLDVVTAVTAALHQNASTSGVNGGGLCNPSPPRGTPGSLPRWETVVIFFTSLTLPWLQQLTRIRKENSPPT